MELDTLGDATQADGDEGSEGKVAHNTNKDEKKQV